MFVALWDKQILILPATMDLVAVDNVKLLKVAAQITVNLLAKIVDASKE